MSTNLTDLRTSKKVQSSNLRHICDESVFPFETTADFADLQDEMIGQKRAIDAMEFGLSVPQSGYNLFVVGPAGTGRTTFTKNKAKKFAENRPIPDDWCYVNNFDHPDHPIAISFPAGEGSIFQREIDTLVVDIKEELRRVFSSNQYDKQKNELLAQFESQGEELWDQLDTFAKELQFKIERTPTGINTFPLRFGRPLETHEYQTLPEAMKEDLKTKGKKLEEKIKETLYHIQKIEREMRKEVESYMHKSALYATSHLFEPLYEKYKHHEKAIQYLKAFNKDVSDHYQFFLTKKTEEPNLLDMLAATQESQAQTRYKVNIIVSHDGNSGAPFIYETNPTFNNLFGKIEYKGSFGNWSTDYTQIKPGSLHLANGGYLIMQATDLLSEPYTWRALKRTLQTGTIFLQNPVEERSFLGTTGLKPESIPLHIKIILIGPAYLYEMLAKWDEDFLKLFKVKVEFDVDMARDEEHYLQMASFVKTYTDKENLLPFHRGAIARVIDYSSKLVEDQRKLSTRFQDITKILVEASFWAQKDKKQVVEASHVIKALEQQHYRSNRVAETLRSMISDGTIMVDTEGERVGQINGLAVLGTRDYSFGLPSRITAQTFVGKTGIINIERETALSGEIHSKGLYILSGYLSGVFAQNRPLPLSASITFEQTYNMIDGDSASSTELYVLLSSLANVPIDQGIAVTGSVNQWGEIQPIGGVNDKIEGYYYVCKEKGITGRQGVIIPHQNVKNLMLTEEVVNAVEDGLFHIWAIETVAEGIEILTGIPAGNIPDENGKFPDSTIFSKVNHRLDQMVQTALQKK